MMCSASGPLACRAPPRKVVGFLALRDGIALNRGVEEDKWFLLSREASLVQTQ